MIQPCKTWYQLGVIEWDLILGDQILSNDKSPIYLELGTAIDGSCDSNFIYYLQEPNSSIGYDEITEEKIILFSDFLWMDYDRVKNCKRIPAFKWLGNGLQLILMDSDLSSCFSFKIGSIFC